MGLSRVSHKPGLSGERIGQRECAVSGMRAISHGAGAGLVMGLWLGGQSAVV